MTTASITPFPAGGVEHELQRRLLRLVCAVATVLGCGYGIYFSSLGQTTAAASGPVCLAIVAVAFGVGRAAHRSAVGLDLACSLLFVFLACMTLLQDGVRSPALWWLAVPPLIALLASRWLLGVLLCALFVGHAFILRAHGSGSWARLSLLTEDPAAQLSLSMTLAVLSAGVFVGLGTHWSRRARQDSEATRLAALAEADAKSRFMSVLSHEIRTPLQAVIGASELLSREGVAADKRDEAAAAQRQGADLLMALVDDVLDFAKLSAGKVTLETMPVRLPALLEDVRNLFVAQAGAKGLALSVSVSPDVPETLIGDRARIQQILLNLIANAIKFTGNGGVQVHLGLGGDSFHSARRTVDRMTVRIAVSDSGVGIEPAALASLFEPFHQADPSIARRYGGTGLGLSISQELAGLMGGRIDVTSAPGRGSTFTLVVPLALAPAAAAVPHGNPARPRSASLRSGLVVLVADDDPANRTVLTAMLDFLAVRSVVVEDGAQAIELLERQRFDVVLMDVRMPMLDGLEVTRRWREIEAGTSDRRMPIIGITGTAEVVDMRACAAAGMDDVLTKPFGVDDLRLLLADVLPSRDGG
jgi:signal transduction histidine kinase/ActR/RegA family two-component response regulator